MSKHPSGYDKCPACGARFEHGPITFDDLADAIGREEARKAQTLYYFCGSCGAEFGNIVNMPSAVADKAGDGPGPVAVCRRLFEENPTLSRADAVALAMQHNVAEATAKTQYQRWYSKNKH
jgi:hypothetical protein